MSKKILQAFYKAEALIHPEILADFLHPEVIVEWRSTTGLIRMNYEELVEMSTELSRAYVRSHIRVTHIISDKDQVASRYSHFVRTLENPNEEILLAHFMAIWEFKDGKMYRGFQMSQVS